MSRTPIGRHLARTLVGLAATAAVAAPAAAAPVGVSGGATDLHLDRATAAALADLGLRVAPVGPATASGARVTFPVTGGAIDPVTAAGRVAHSGGLAFSAAGTTVRVTDFVSARTNHKEPVLTAKAGSARLPLLALDLRDAKVLRRGPGGVGTWVVRVQAGLAATAAAALNGAFGSHLAAGTSIGRVNLRVQPSEVELAGSATTLALDPGTSAALTGLGVTPSVIPPGTAGAAGLSFPVTGGTLAAGSRARSPTAAASPSPPARPGWSSPASESRSTGRRS